MHVRRFANPWWLLSGAIAGGLAWAVGLPVWASAVIGVIIWLTSVLVFGFLFPQPAASPAAVPASDPAAACAHRAHAAAASFEELAAPLANGPLGDRIPRMIWRVHEIAASIGHLARRSGELSALEHAPAHDPRSQERARLVGERHAEVRRRMHAATDDLEAALPRFLDAVSAPHSSPDVAAVDRLAGMLENIGYGVDIGEGIVDEILGPESPGAPGAVPR